MSEQPAEARGAPEWDVADRMRKGRAPTYIYSRKLHIRRLAAALPVPLLDATRAHILTWRAAMPHTAGGVCGYVSHARQFYAWALTQGLIDNNPADSIPVPRKPRRLPRPIAETDLMAALEAAPPRIRMWIVLAAWCGLRACEIAYLRAECIRLGDGVLLVAADATKGHREHAIPLCDFAAAELAAAGLPIRGWTFRRADGQRGPNKPWRVSQLANEYLHDCGIAASLHQLRHRFGSQTYRGTHDLRAVQEMMGHSSPVTTAGYAELHNESAIAAVAALPVPRQLRQAA